MLPSGDLEGDDLPVLVLTGPPGSGKTTVAHALATRFEHAAHLEADRFFGFIRSGYMEPWESHSHPQNTVVMRIVANAAGAYARAGYFTILDGIVLPRWFLRPVQDWLESEGHSVAYVVLRAARETCVSRAARRTGEGLADRAVIERLWQDFSDLGALEAHAVDNDCSTPEHTAELIAAALGGRLLLSREPG